MSSRHVVFGVGQIGTHVAQQLCAGGHDVVTVSRSGRVVVPGATALGADLSHPNDAAHAAAGAAVIYFCLNASRYDRWPEEFPPLQRAAVEAARRSGARLVVLENLYGYGPTGGLPLTETLPPKPIAAKARTRVEMTDELLAAHGAGTLDVAIGRASDFFGPGVTQSALGEQLLRAVLAGRRAQVMGDPDLPHSYSYAPDVARGLIALGAASTSGSIWHLPIAATLTTRALVEQLFAAAGTRPRVIAAGAVLLRVAALFKPELGELRHTLYQFSEPWIVADTKFRAAFGDLSTPLHNAIDTTVEWYRTNAPKETP